MVTHPAIPVDYPTLLRLIDKYLPIDITCYCEHLTTEEDYIHNFKRIHRIAEEVSVEILPRTV